MRIFISILFNAFILYALTFLLWENPAKGIYEPWIVVEWWITTYIIWGVIIWLINASIKPILKLLSLPFFFLFVWLASLIINGIILKLFTYILNNILMIPDVSYEINWVINFIIAVAIFSILNTLYTLLFSKK